jgi:calmodulin
MSSPKVPKSAAPKFFSANPSPTDNAPIVANASSQKSLATQLWSTPKSDVSQSTPQDGGREEFYKSEAETAWDIIFDYLIDPTLFAGIEDLFRALDRKGNGRLDHYDLEQGLLSSGCPLTNTMVTELRKNLDKNGDGTVDLDEFLAAARENSARHAATNVLVQEAWDILNRFVINTTGMRQDVCTLFRRTGQENNVLAFDELSRGLRGLGLKISNPQLKALYPEIDANKDGKISLQEWVTAIEEYRQASPEEDAQTLLNAWDSILDETLTSDGLASIKSMFKLADVDGDGGLSLQELARGLLSCGIRMTPRQLRLLQRDLDENKDGDISFEEFESKVQRFQAASPLNREAADEAWDLAINVFMDPNRNESVSDMFRRMDKDGNLEVDISELAQGMASLGVPLTARQLRGFQKTLDSNGDGSISHSEFVQALRRERVKLEDALTDAWNKVIECTIGDVHGKVRDLFDSMDTSNDGVLDMTELSMGLRLMGISLSPRAERAFLKDVDTSGEGEVDFDEFLEGIRRYQQSSEIDEDAAHEAWQVLLKYFAGDTANAELHSLFKHFDEDKSQGLDLAELARGLLGIGLHLTSKQLRALQKSLDKNGDGKITFQEFMLSIEDKQANKLSGSWEQVTSTSDGATYWHNTVTGETSWDPPNILQKSVPSKMPAVNRSNDVHLPSSQPFAYSNYEKIPVDSEGVSAWDHILDFLFYPNLFEGIENLFRVLDRDGNGRLDYPELEKYFQTSGFMLTESMSAGLRKDLDKNGDGTVDLNELIASARVHGSRQSTKTVLTDEAWSILNKFVVESTRWGKGARILFKEIDTNNSNVLAFDDFLRGLRQLGLAISNDHIKALYLDMDTSKDGKISFAEWIVAIEEHDRATSVGDAQMLLNAWDFIMDVSLDPNGMGSIQKLFQVADVDGDGNLSLQELARGFLSCGIEMTPRQLRLIQHDLDENKDGSISYDEFTSKVQRFQATSPLNREAADEAWDLAINVFMDPNRNESVSDMFRRMDKDGNLEVDIDELAQGMVSLGVPLTARQLRGFQKTLDSNGDGSISHSEFVQALRLERVKLEDALTDAWNKVIECTIGDIKGKVRSLFDAMDTSNDGVLDMKELSMGLRLIGVNLPPRAERAFLKDVDTSGEGEIDFEEFLEGVRRFQQSSEIDEDAAHEAWIVLLKYFANEGSSTELRSLFVRMDENRNQSLDLAELARGLLGIGLHLTSKQLRALQKSLDKNGDGKITFQEFMLSIEDKQAIVAARAWEQVTSTSDGAMYWHNTITGETSWDAPP